MKAFIPASVIRRAAKDGVELSRDLVTIVRPDPRLHIPMPAGADFKEWLEQESANIEHDCDGWTQQDIDDFGPPSEWCGCCMFRSEMTWRWETRQSLLNPRPSPPPPPKPTEAELLAAAARKEAGRLAFSKWLQSLNPILKAWFETGDKRERQFIYETEFLGLEHDWCSMMDLMEPGWEERTRAEGLAREAADLAAAAAREAAKAEREAAEAAAAAAARGPGHPLFGERSPHEWIHTARNKDVDELVADFNAWQNTPKDRRPIWCGVGQRTLPGQRVGGEGNVSMRISNVSDRIRLWDVREFCAAAGGRVRDVFHPAPGGVKRPFLFVEFPTQEECERAVATLSAAPVVLYGRELRFEVSVNADRGRPAGAAAPARPAAPAPAAAAPVVRAAAPVRPAAAPRRGAFAALAADSDSD